MCIDKLKLNSLHSLAFLLRRTLTNLYTDSIHLLTYSPMMFKLKRDGRRAGVGSSAKERKEKKVS